jgi:hypothetical protein
VLSEGPLVLDVKEADRVRIQEESCEDPRMPFRDRGIVSVEQQEAAFRRAALLAGLSSTHKPTSTTKRNAAAGQPGRRTPPTYSFASLASERSVFTFSSSAAKR